MVPAGRRWLLAIAAASALAVALALVAQHGLGMQPCPWCILQRLIYVVVAVVAAVAAFTRQPVRNVLAGAVLLLCIAGAVSAVYQHVVAAKQFSCNLTFADQVITALGVESAMPWLFRVTATCADAAVSVLGVPFEYWSLAMFVLLGAAAAKVTFGGGR